MMTVGYNYILRTGEAVKVIDRAPAGFGVDFDCEVVEGTSRMPRGCVVTLHSSRLAAEVIA